MSERISRPGNRADKKKLAPPERNFGIYFCPSKIRPHTAAHPQPDQKNPQDNRKSINSRPHHKRQQPRPNYLGTQRARAGNSNGHINSPGFFYPHAAGGHFCHWRIVLSPFCQSISDKCHGKIKRDRHISRRNHIVQAQQIKPCEQTPANSTGNISPVKKAKPRNAARR